MIIVIVFLTAEKSRAEARKFLDFMDLPSHTYMKWPLITLKIEKKNNSNSNRSLPDFKSNPYFNTLP